MQVKQLLREVCYERAGSFSSIHGRELSHIPPSAQLADPVSCWPLYTMAFCCCYRLPEVSTRTLGGWLLCSILWQKDPTKAMAGRERKREGGWFYLAHYSRVLSHHGVGSLVAGHIRKQREVPVCTQLMFPFWLNLAPQSMEWWGAPQHMWGGSSHLNWLCLEIPS